jgi:hypothetical protein
LTNSACTKTHFKITRLETQETNAIMVNNNPMYHLKHAWEGTTTVWGKVCIVLFYSFVWLNILLSIQEIIAPELGAECFYQGLSDYVLAGIDALMRGLQIFTIGFLLYADRGGIKVRNVSMVFFVFLFFAIVLFKAMNAYPSLDGYPSECDMTLLFTMNCVFVVWPGLALIASILEARASAGNSSSGETQPLLL